MSQVAIAVRGFVSCGKRRHGVSDGNSLLAQAVLTLDYRGAKDPAIQGLGICETHVDGKPRTQSTLGFQRTRRKGRINKLAKFVFVRSQSGLPVACTLLIRLAPQDFARARGLNASGS